jgi:hypothetical protein
MYKDLEGTHKLEQLVQGMNSKRTVFNWTHLDKIAAEPEIVFFW